MKHYPLIIGVKNLAIPFLFCTLVFFYCKPLSKIMQYTESMSQIKIIAGLKKIEEPLAFLHTYYLLLN